MIQAVGQCGSTTGLTMVIPLSVGTHPSLGAGILELLCTLVTLMVIPEMIFYVMIRTDRCLLHTPIGLDTLFEPDGIRQWVSAHSHAVGVVSS